MKLANLDCFNEIVIQMHDNPDADAVGSGYALYRYFESKGKRVRLIYGGRERIKKSNMLLLLRSWRFRRNISTIPRIPGDQSFC